MTQVTILFKSDVGTPFPGNRIQHSDVTGTALSDGILLVRVALGKDRIDHRYPMRNILVVTESPMPEEDEE